MSLMDELVALEKQFWLGDAEFYDRALAEAALMAFADPVGVLDRRRIIAAIAASPRWSYVVLDDVHSLMLAPHAAILTYRATARRAAADPPYAARASSAYVDRGSGWKLVFHQQTPM